MRICVIATSYPAHEGDASGHFVRAEVRGLERAGHEVVVVTPPAGGAFGWPGVAARLRESPMRALSAVRWVSEARSAVRGANAERIVAHWAIPCAWPIASAVFPGRIAPIPGPSPAGAGEGSLLHIVSHGGDVRLLTKLPAPIRIMLVEHLLARASRWRFVSASLRDALREAIPHDLHAAFDGVAWVEASPIELPDVRARAEELRRDFAGRPFAVSVGRLVPGKRVERAIAHAARTGLALVVVGDGPERGRLEAEARSRGTGVRFVGKVPRNEALAWISAADVLLQASREEGRSTVEREAAAFGVRIEVL